MTTKTKTKEAKKLDQTFTENINDIMMPVNNMQTARFGGRWDEVKSWVEHVRTRLDNIEAVADEMLGLAQIPSEE
jgi:hypothetical protein